MEVGRITFGSNVAPKVIKKPAPEPWYCHKCDHEVSPWHRKCPSCRQTRD